MEHSTYKISITGTVQGVGFRPFVYSLAQRYILCGNVSNHSRGVTIHINADRLTLQQFLLALEYEHPALASLQSIEHKEIQWQDFSEFEILQTQESGEVHVNIPPDISICQTCQEELFNSSDRRFQYPFITCTACGVRYSIVYDLPYDRANTSMKFFKMCKTCELEYNNPLDRRYHAQPIGCWECGPTMQVKKSGKTLDIPQKEIVERVSTFLKEGSIIALKGVGGYHLICDARNEHTLAILRERKHRPSKPFAIMVKNIEMARELAEISKQEEESLLSKERPIVLLDAKESTLADAVAPKIKRVGILLPYTPLHLLLLEKLKLPLVATSANITDEPICTNLEQLEKLEGVYDYILDHDREILNACDDSVVMFVSGQQVTLRRARGYAPSSVTLPFHLKTKRLALGANQKSSVAIAYENSVILSPHIGDLNSLSSVQHYKKNIQTLQRIYRFQPDTILHDKHPQYESTKVAQVLASEDSKLQLQGVSHHYAHILGVMAEKGLTQKVFGVAFDGTGYGEDRKLWGGEFMLCDYKGYERIAHLKYFKLLGGSKAIKEPKRVALSLLFEAYAKDALDLDTPTLKVFSKKELDTYYIAWKKGLNAPLSSSVGRVFDAVASLVDVCHVMNYEGESGMLLEELYDDTIEESYPFTCKDGLIDMVPIIKAIVQEDKKSVAVSKFFNTLIEIITYLYQPYNLPLVVSGGVFQNRILLKLLLRRFPDAIIPNLFPPNDGGIALGQTVAPLLLE